MHHSAFGTVFLVLLIVSFVLWLLLWKRVVHGLPSGCLWVLAGMAVFVVMIVMGDNLAIDTTGYRQFGGLLLPQLPAKLEEQLVSFFEVWIIANLVIFGGCGGFLRFVHRSFPAKGTDVPPLNSYSVSEDQQ